MKGVQPLKKIVVIVALVAAAGVLHVGFYGKALAEFDQVQMNLDEQAEKAAKKQDSVMRAQQIQYALGNTERQLEGVRARLEKTPDVRQLWNRMEIDLRRKSGALRPCQSSPFVARGRRAPEALPGHVVVEADLRGEDELPSEREFTRLEVHRRAGEVPRLIGRERFGGGHPL